MNCVTLETVKKMSDEELRVAVAKLDGWESIAKTRHGYLEGFKPGVNYVGVPDYPHDLNAVHEVEQSLSEDQKWQYGLLLANVVRTPENVAFCDPPNKAFPLNELGLFELANLTARQRCEALVLCLSPDSKNTHA